MRPFFLFKSGKKTDGVHLKQMREGLRNNLFILFSLSLPLYKIGLWLAFRCTSNKIEICAFFSKKIFLVKKKNVAQNHI